MAKLTQTGELLSDRLAAAGTLDPELVGTVLGQLLGQVEQLHANGQLHRAIRAHTVWIDQTNRATLQPPPSEPISCITANSEAMLPPELEAIGELQLPHRIEQAEAALKKHGATVDPRHIDLFQLGQLALELLTGASEGSYLMSPKIKTSVPAEWRKWIDSALGFTAAERAANCAQLRKILDDIAPGQARQEFEATPPTGTGVDVQRDTPLLGSKLVSDSPDESLPFAQLGHYRIDARLGSGGMGDVYRGYDPRLDRTVAIKVLPSELARNQDFVNRFHSEARAAAQLAHPHIVPIYFIGEDHGTHFFAMQFVDGPSLAELLQSRGVLAADHALDLVGQVAKGLAAAHARGLIHRDIKPGNVLLDKQTGQAKLADFGLVKSLGSNLQATATGVVMGTVDYISPEQGRGQKVDGRSDLYSLGVLLYQLLSGKLPFEADSPTAMIFQHAYEQPTPLVEATPEVPSSVVSIVDRLLLKNPDDRYQSAESLATDLKAVRAGGEPKFEDATTNVADTRIILAPEIDFSRADHIATATHIPMIDQGWRTRLLAKFNQHAPSALKDLQNTQQQVDGGIAVYTDRRNKLAALAEEARSVEKQLAEQAAEQEAAAAAARLRASKASSSSDRREAERQEQLHREAADMLAAQLVEQEVQSEQINLRLARVDTTLEKLRSQRQLLIARLEAAQANVAVASIDEHGRHDRPKVQKLALPIAIAAAALIVAWVLASRPSDRQKDNPRLSQVESSDATFEPSSNTLESIDLLSKIQLDRDTIHGRWKFENESLVSPPSVAAARVQIPFDLPDEYQLTVVAERREGQEYFVIGLVVDGKQCMLMLDWRAEKISGISNVDGMQANANETTRRGKLLDFGKSSTIVINVRKDRIHATCDGREIVNWQGDSSRLSLIDYWRIPNPQALFVASTRSVFRISKLELGPYRDHRGHATLSRSARTTAERLETDSENRITPADGQVDLLPLIDAKTHAVSGIWKRTEAGVTRIQKHGGAKSLAVPVLIDGSYELLATYRAKSGAAQRATRFVLPFGVGRGGVTFGRDNKKVQCAISGVDGFLAQDPKNPTHNPLYRYTANADRHVRIRVELIGEDVNIEVTENNEPIMSFKGRQDRIKASPTGKHFVDNRLVLSAWGNTVTFSRLELTMLDGHAEILRDPAQGTETAETTPDDFAAGKLPTGTWQINFPAGAQRAVTLTSLGDDEMLLRTGGNLGGVYRWDQKQLVMKSPDDKRYQQLMWRLDGNELVLADEPPDHPSGARYLGTRMKFVTRDTTSEAQARVPRKPSSVGKKKNTNHATVSTLPVDPTKMVLIMGPLNTGEPQQIVEVCKRYDLNTDLLDGFDPDDADYSAYHTIILSSNQLNRFAKKKESYSMHLNAFVENGGHLFVFGSYNSVGSAPLVSRYGIRTGFQHSDSFKRTGAATDLLFQGNEHLVPADGRLRSTGNIACDREHTVLLNRGPGKVAGAPKMLTMQVGEGRFSYTQVEPYYAESDWILEPVVSWISRGSPIPRGGER